MVKVIRTDKWKLAATAQQLQVLTDTRDKYRDLTRFLITVVNTHWSEIASSKDPLRSVERLIHATKHNPSPKYGKSFGVGSRFYKIPCLFRRAAINDAIGVVSSFQTKYREWQGRSRKRRDAKPPRLNINCSVNPDFYKGTVEFSNDFSSAKIKVFMDNDWKWITIGVVSQGKRHLLDEAVVMSPSLVIERSKAHLSIPIKVKVPRLVQTEKVCAVDLGINTTAVCSVVDYNGVVHDRLFLHDGKALDKRDKHLRQVAKKSALTMGSGGNLHKGFARLHYRKAAGINKNMASHIAKQIIVFAQRNNATTIVFENLKGWKPKGRKSKPSLKQRFHDWLKSAITTRVEELGEELGISIQFVYARGTSSYAYDGSGEVKRDSKNYSLATFKTGKRYNCDLSACYNIATRYIAFKLKLTHRNDGQLPFSKSSKGKRRAPVTLSRLWDDVPTVSKLCA